MEFLVTATGSGHVRELQNAVERLVALAAGPIIGPEDVTLLDGGAPERRP